MRCCSAFYRLREVVVPAFEVTNSACVLVFWLWYLIVCWCFGWNKTVNHQFLAPHQHQVTSHTRVTHLRFILLPFLFLFLSQNLNPQLPITISRHSSQYWLSTRALLSWSPSSVMAATKPSRKTKLMLMQQNVMVAMQ